MGTQLPEELTLFSAPSPSLTAASTAPAEAASPSWSPAAAQAAALAAVSAAAVAAAASLPPAAAGWSAGRPQRHCTPAALSPGQVGGQLTDGI